MGYIKNIAIVGATGTIGSRIVSEFLAQGKHTITAITRTDSNAHIPPGVNIAKVDYSDPTSLVVALRGHQALIITLPPASEGIQGQLVDAAAEADISYIVTNGWGFDKTHISAEDVLGPGQQAINKRIEELGMSWIEFVSGFWYEFSLARGVNTFGFDFEQKTVLFLDEGTARINVATWEQTAQAVVKVFTLKEFPDNEQDEDNSLSRLKNTNIYFKSFLVSQKDMFESVLRVTGDRREDWKVSYETSENRFKSGQQILQQGDRTGFMRLMYARMFYPEETGDGSGAFEHWGKLLNEELGLPREDFDERTKVALEGAKDFTRFGLVSSAYSSLS
ncbi:related to oxidoreductase CipA-like [Cephalotrichum gorgonifer]|uniref:Related to oxidoreductase CipA-like n=1 Tax=Cephalotrichum gorgonifer TaxID=2041049 RepID=A0AAE8N5P8_9PEZI|nr:related to oxidoreductase CipA-like [Cephalotrichum gorgonifer]